MKKMKTAVLVAGTAAITVLASMQLKANAPIAAARIFAKGPLVEKADTTGSKRADEKLVNGVDYRDGTIIFTNWEGCNFDMPLKESKDWGYLTKKPFLGIAAREVDGKVAAYIVFGTEEKYEIYRITPVIDKKEGEVSFLISKAIRDDSK